MRPRQSIDIGAFQFQRTKKRRLSAFSSSSKPKHSQLPPRPPLRERTNLQNPLTPAHTEPALSVRSSAPAPEPTSPRPAQKKSREPRLPLHTQIDDSLPNPDKIRTFFSLAIERAVAKGELNASEQMRAKSQQHSKLVMDRASNFIDAFYSPVLEQCKPNPEEEHVELKIAQMEQLEKACMDELSMWDKVIDISKQSVEWPNLDDSTQQQQHSDLSQPQELLQQSTEILETYVLHTHHMFALAKRMHNLNLDTQCRVQAVAAALNQKVISQFGGRPGEPLKPLDLLPVGPIDQNPLI